MKPGISNRRSADEEDRVRRAHPPLDAGPPQPTGGAPDEDVLAGEVQTSHKAGSKSTARRTSGSRYPDRSMPASRKVAGAYGAEPEGPSARDRERSSHPGLQAPASAPRTPAERETPAQRDRDSQVPTGPRRQKRTTI